ncbi:uncharacterized protein LOC121418479 [Lytechinus variegatus]|uniref:uncharacterized protein LOC121418479 n=1 Tax=Lytechinus variegatus TaxID=7654 RepID=UPI001BB16896|nr:uncharacterized protein LOC121418479 [Lytechinus variegatus]XP_041468319.1 uncharacterized protein LOC121418479 [Lytechinus variegatus]
MTEGGGVGENDPAQGDAGQPKSWWEKQRREAASFSVEDCPECRYVGGFGMYGAALYVGYTSIRRQKLAGRTLWGAVPALTVSAVMVGLGTARLLRINPFSSSGNELGIDLVDQALRNLVQPADNEHKNDNVER